jgi:hypothetical protein
MVDVFDFALDGHSERCFKEVLHRMKVECVLILQFRQMENQ